MKKFVITTMAFLLMVTGISVANADDGLEISGHINTGAAYQFQTNKPASTAGGALLQEQIFTPRMNPEKRNSFGFYLYDVEVDIAKSFGEDIRLRTDLDFGRFNSYSPSNRKSFEIEQAYVAFDLFGAEILVGRFNVPMGIESVDINDNYLPMHSLLYTALKPHNLTGIKAYYKFTDMLDMHLWVVNNLRDSISFNNNAPAFGGRIGFDFGRVQAGISGAASPEVHTDRYGDWSYLGDLDVNFAINDKLSIGAEGLFRQDSAPKGLKDNRYYAGLTNIHYVFSDVWDGTIQYAYVNDKGGQASLNATGASQMHPWGVGTSATGGTSQYHEMGAGVTYHITDGAKIQGMYRFDYIIPDKKVFKDNGMAHSLVANFAYEF